MKKLLLVCLVITFTTAGYSEGLFESLFSSEGDNTGYELNGHVRASMFSNRDVDDTKYSQSEFALRFRADKGKWGNAFAEVRYISNFYRNETFSSDIQNDFEIREAYINLFTGHFDFRIGNQIINWGRADGYNPTDLINPKVIGPMPLNEDDRHSPNFMVRAVYTTGNVRFEGIFIPNGKTSPFSFAHNGYLYNGNAKAGKISFESSSIDGSISYYYGINPNSVRSYENGYYSTSTYKIRAYGADFSTTSENFGIRGEISYKEVSKKSPNYNISSEMEYIMGIDKSFNIDGNIILQYIGKYVEDPDDSNESIYGQQEEYYHSITCRLSHTFLYETLEIEDLARYNFTTDELFNRIKVTYDITDAFEIVAGADYTDGPKGTQADQAKDDMSKAFTELKISF